MKVYNVSVQLYCVDDDNKPLRLTASLLKIFIQRKKLFDDLIRMAFLHDINIVAISRNVKLNKQTGRLSFKVVGTVDQDYIRRALYNAPLEDTIYEGESALIKIKSKWYFLDYRNLKHIIIVKSSVQKNDKFVRNEKFLTQY